MDLAIKKEGNESGKIWSTGTRPGKTVWEANITSITSKRLTILKREVGEKR